MTARMRMGAPAALLCCLTALVPSAGGAQDDLLRTIQTKQAELREREDSVRREEERIAALRKDVDARIRQYSELLTRVEAAINRLEQVRDDKLDGVVKAYEAMPPEDAALRLAALDHETALLIMLRMRSKKAGAVMASMDPRKAAELTRSMTRELGARPRPQKNAQDGAGGE